MKNIFDIKSTAKDALSALCSDKLRGVRAAIYLALSLFSSLSAVILLYTPFCKTSLNPDPLTPIGIFEHSLIGMNDSRIAQLAVFIAVLLIIIADAWLILGSVFSLRNEKMLSAKTRNTAFFNTVACSAYAVLSYLFSPIYNMLGGQSEIAFSVLPLLIAASADLLYALITGLVRAHANALSDEDTLEQTAADNRRRLRKKLLFARLELLGYTAISAVFCIGALFSNIIAVNYLRSNTVIGTITVNGYDLIFNSANLTDSADKTVAYVLFVILVLVGAALFLSVISLLSGSELYPRLSVTSITVSVVSCMLIGLFSKYYEIVQDLNDGLLSSLISSHFPSSGVLYDYTVEGNALYFFLAVLPIVAVLFFRQPYTKSIRIARRIAAEDNARLPQVVEISNIDDVPVYGDAEKESAATKPAKSTHHDPCPAFTALDARLADFRADTAQREGARFDGATLPAVVDHIVRYARESRLHLFYTHENVATFLAGLGATKLTILQGMSGTGKTSLPKIVAEALGSTCDIIEVESSWRDKNELLGYYNEFSKTFTPRKFTEALYKARLNPETLTFIVLDEMNLSRIEYYFSDFLSLMENEPANRYIKLLSTPIYPADRSHYEGLTDGTTVKIPENVWFIGTANRDESTFDISDKVYDRAHTMNFDKRAEKAAYTDAPLLPAYLPADAFISLVEAAKAQIPFSLDSRSEVAALEALLSPYGISFGNRIALQIESFVKVYAACLTPTEGVIRDALDIILLSKVVRKLELKSIDDKEVLADEIARLGLERCARFVQELRED